MKIFMTEWSMPYHLEVALKLKMAGVYPQYWTAAPGYGLSFEKLKEAFPGIIIHESLEAMRGNPAPGLATLNFQPPSEQLLEKLSTCEIYTLSMMDRFDYSGLKVLQKRIIFSEMVRYWNGILNKYHPDAVFFSITPHMVYDFVLYCLCKLSGIRTIMLDNTRIPGRMLMLEDYKVGCSEILTHLKGYSKTEIKAQDLAADLQKYLNHFGPNADKVPTNVQRFFDFKSLSRSYGYFSKILVSLRHPKSAAKNLLKVPYLTADRDYGILEYRLKRYGWEQHKRKLTQEYKALSKPVNLKLSYVFFPLQYQPERTSNPLGGVYTNQKLALETLSVSIPKDWVIYVKEHPKQIFPGGSHAHQGRYLGYYKDLTKIPNVHIVPIETSNFALIRYSKLVATISGTPGWEAVLRGIPCAIFGYPWYQDCPGVYPLRSAESCADIKHKIESGELKVDPLKVLRFMKALEDASIYGYIDHGYEKESGLSQDSSMTAIVKGFLKKMNHQDSHH